MLILFLFDLFFFIVILKMFNSCKFFQVISAYKVYSDLIEMNDIDGNNSAYGYCLHNNQFFLPLL